MGWRTPLLAGMLLLLPGNSLPATVAIAKPVVGDGIVDVQFTGLRSEKGMVRACLTRNPQYFPHCENDPASYKQSVVAGPDAHLRFSNVIDGDYAITVLHDENQNFRADMMFGIPREGVGFSENPKLHFGPPKFAACRFRVEAGEVLKKVVLRYFL